MTSQKRPLEARALQPDTPTVGLLLSRSVNLPGQLLCRGGAELSCVNYRVGFEAWDAHALPSYPVVLLRPLGSAGLYMSYLLD